MEASRSYGSRACAHLGAAREQVIEFSHPRTAATSDGAKTDALDARRGARGSSDAQTSPSHAPRAAARHCERCNPPAEAPRRRAPHRSTNSKPSPSAHPSTCATNSAASPPPPKSSNAPLAPAGGPLDELTATKQALRSLAPR